MHDTEIPWTFVGLADFFSSVIERGKLGSVFLQAFERGLPWTEGIKLFSTGVNGLHAAHFGDRDLARCRNDAGEIAALAMMVTNPFSSWRCLEATAGPQGVYSVTLYGGRYTNPAKP